MCKKRKSVVKQPPKWQSILKYVAIATTVLAFLGIIGCLIAYFCVNDCQIKNILLEMCKLSVLVFQAGAMILTILLALQTYQTSKRVENAKAILDIRQTLSKTELVNIHKFIDENKNHTESGDNPDFSTDFNEFWRDNKLAIYDYLGTLELLYIYIEEGIIDVDDFRSQHGYRLKNIIRYDELLKKIEYQQQTYPGWSKLISLLELADDGERTYKFPKHIKH